MSMPAIVLQPQTKYEPATIRAGDTVVWERSFQDFPSSTFTLSYAIVSRTHGYAVTAIASLDTSGAFAVYISAATTAAWVPDTYRWEAYARDTAGERVTLDQGTLRVLINLETATGGVDDRHPDEKILDAIRDLMAGKVLAGDAMMYEIHGRKLQRYAFHELKALRSEYALRVRSLRAQRGERVSSRTKKAVFCG